MFGLSDEIVFCIWYKSLDDNGRAGVRRCFIHQAEHGILDADRANALEHLNVIEDCEKMLGNDWRYTA